MKLMKNGIYKVEFTGGAKVVLVMAKDVPDAIDMAWHALADQQRTGVADVHKHYQMDGVARIQSGYARADFETIAAASIVEPPEESPMPMVEDKDGLSRWHGGRFA